jgi:hypothetical protein
MRRNPPDAKFCVGCSMQFRRRRIVAVGAVFAIVSGMLVLWPTHDFVHFISPIPSALPHEGTPLEEWSVLAQRAVYSQVESVPAIPSSQPAPPPAPASVVKNTQACTQGVAALGLCPSEPERPQSAAPIGSSTDVASPPVKERAKSRCNEAAVALGLCAQ